MHITGSHLLSGGEMPIFPKSGGKGEERQHFSSEHNGHSSISSFSEQNRETLQTSLLTHRSLCRTKPSAQTHPDLLEIGYSVLGPLYKKIRYQIA